MSHSYRPRPTGIQHTRKPSELPAKITAYLTEHPGAQLYAIVSGVQASRGAVTYHLRALTAKGAIKVHEETGCRRYYIHNFTYTKEEAVIKTFLENETKAAVIIALQNNPGLGRKDIAEKTGIPENTLYRHIAALFSAGVLKRERDGHKWRYRLSAKTERLQKERRR